ncbi:MAG: bifunctional 23S rRNA (guanine(2069)-N(7))-methyltransferase RlmK/23S rRNA (guanine(2445)-N(2))-methyltransferase RlmL [Gammaproteobacteria bacterium]
MSTESLKFIASAPRGFADLLARELTSFGARDVRERSTGVAFTGPLEVAYRACLHSRVANRVFLEIAEFEAGTADEFYAWSKRVDWAAHIGPDATIACDFTGKHPTITHTHFGALKLKDAIVDSVRDQAGYRPDVSIDKPGVRVHAHANRSKIALSLDLSGESLHRRGYRGAGGEAPLKENVAAGVLIRAGWPELAAAGAEFLDPMCGSGTFVIEAAMIAADIAPGLGRDYFGFIGWRQHDAALWERLRAEASARVRSADDLTAMIRGQDRDATAIRGARANAQRAQVEEIVRFAVQSLADAKPSPRAAQARAAAPAPSDTDTPSAAASGTTPATDGPHDGGATISPEEPAPKGGAPTRVGLVCVNPPYGIRLEDHQKARQLHKELGEILRTRFEGWQAVILTGSPDLGLELGLRAHRVHTVWNGAIECRLLRINVEPSAARTLIADRGAARIDASLRESNGAKMFGNRLGKNIKQLSRWVRDSGVSCYRLYDADMPEYAFAIDSYKVIGEDKQPPLAEAQVWLHVQEYAAPATIEEEAVRRRRAEAFSVLPEVTGVPAERIRVRLRKKQTRGSQYQKVAEQFRFHIVEEGGLKLRVNFDDYLDTGLFLDHRPTRARIRELANGKRFLNLFAYTSTATVYAAAGGARASTSVDLSRTYLEWSERNLGLNGLATRHHELVQADCREWLEAAARTRNQYDLIFLDPPTFSNSKRMEGVLDTGRDHPELIEVCMQVLAPGGLLVFSTNAQKFKLDPALAERYDVKDVSVATIPRDFERNPRIHRCYDIRHRGSS